MQTPATTKETGEVVITDFGKGTVYLDRDELANALVDYAAAKAHAAGAQAWADIINRADADHGPAYRRRNESADVAAGHLQALALMLYCDPDDVLAHEDFVARIDDAILDGYAAGWDGHEPEPLPLGQDVVGFDTDELEATP